MPLITGLVQFENNTTNSLVSLDNNFTTIANAVNGFANAGSALSSSTTFLTASSLTVSGSTIPANGIYLPAANTLGLAANSTLYLSINSTGNIVNVAPSSGVGLTVNDTVGTPASFLSNINAAAVTLFKNTNAGATSASTLQVVGGFGSLFITGQGSGSGTSGDIYSTGAALFRLTASDAAGSIALCTTPSFTQRLVVSNNGNVTINAPVGGTTLALSSVANNPVFSTSDGTAVGTWYSNAASGISIGTTSNHPLGILSNNTTRVTIAAAGGVTINAPSSGQALSVSGISTADTISMRGDHTWGVGFAFTDTNATPHTYAMGLGIGDATANLNIYDRTTGAIRFAILTTGGVTLSTPTSGNHQFNGLTQYSDGTTNAEIGWRNIPSNGVATAYTLVLADRARNVRQTSANTVTLPISVFSADDTGLITNKSGGSISVAVSAGGTITLAGTATTGTRTLANNGVMSWRADTGGATPGYLVSGPGVS